MEVKATLNRYRQSPRKVRLVAHMLEGKPVETACAELGFLVKRAGHPLKKLIDSAIANAEHNFKLRRENLSVRSIIVDEGPTLKRSMPRAFGRSAMIRKRTSHVTVILSDTGDKRSEKRKIKKARLAIATPKRERLKNTI